MQPINDLVATLRGLGPVIVAVLTVGFFATVAVLLWSWRKVALKDEETP
jgi:hypothetical protein